MIHSKANLKTLCSFLGAMLAAGAVSASDQVSLTFHDGWGYCRLEGCFSVQAEPTIAWDVLTDYDQIPSFVGNMKKSHVEGRFDNDLVLAQEMEGGILFFTKRVQVLLDVHEKPLQSIVFEDVRHKDFYIYQGTWNLHAKAGGQVEITYTLEAEQNFTAPLSGDVMQGSIKDLLSAVQREILKRQAQKPKEGSFADSPGQVRWVGRPVRSIPE